MASTEISMLASGTKPAADRGATEYDFVMKEWILSPVEKACLRWISRGMTVAEIATLEGKSVAIIENCLQSALVALKAKSIEEALQKADLGQSD
ncbi:MULTISPECIES: LuxR family transcriptional regulator [Rhizobium/Agrobacterium group]|nr:MULTISPECIES: LuxR family transcriptional regulator [Rhizobium/Agrobacterium group]